MLVLGHSESELHSVWISDFVRKVLKFFEIFSQPAEPVGKPNHPVHWVQFFATVVWVLSFVCIGSWSFGVGIALRLSCWISEFVRKVMENFEIFSPPAREVEKPNQPVHWVQFARMAVWVLCLFMLVLGHSESELPSICLVGFLTL